MLKANIAVLVMLLTTIGWTHAQSVPSYVPLQDLVGWWGFNGDASDASGNGNHGIVNGATPTKDRYGRSNRAFYFRHTDEIVTEFNGISGNQPRTFSFWLKNQYPDKTISPIWYGGSEPSNPVIGSSFNIIFNRNEQSDRCNCWPTIYQGIGITSDWIYSLRSTVVADNQWNHWVVVFDNEGRTFNEIKYYKNGILIESEIIFDFQGNASGTVINTLTHNTLRFGKSMASSENPDKAPTEYLDDVGVWSRALTDVEIQLLYLSDYRQSNMPTDGLLAWYTFEGTVDDASGNGNHGVLRGATLSSESYSKDNSSIYFDGGGGYLDVKLSNNERVDGEITVSLWIKKIIGGSYGARVSSFLGINDRPDETGALTLVWDNGPGLKKPVMIHSNVGEVRFGDNLENEMWHHFTYTAGPDSIRTFVNGRLINSIGNQYPDAVKLGSILNIGRMAYPGYDAFNGYVDDYGIWNRILSDSEIMTLYTGVNETANEMSHLSLSDAEVIKSETVKVTLTTGLISAQDSLDSYQFDLTIPSGLSFSGFDKTGTLSEYGSILR